jgi:HSP20 family protein
MAKDKKETKAPAKKDHDSLSPLSEIERYFDEIFHQPYSLLGQPMWPRPQLAHQKMISPTVDIFEENKEVVVKAEIPGMKKSDISVDIGENSITISGEKKEEKEVDRKDYHRVECSYGSFCRSFRLPGNVISNKAKASFKNGVLEVRMPTTEKGKKKKIAIS